MRTLFDFINGNLPTPLKHTETQSMFHGSFDCTNADHLLLINQKLQAYVKAYQALVEVDKTMAKPLAIGAISWLLSISGILTAGCLGYTCYLYAFHEMLWKEYVGAREALCSVYRECMNDTTKCSAHLRIQEIQSLITVLGYAVPPSFICKWEQKDKEGTHWRVARLSDDYRNTLAELEKGEYTNTWSYTLYGMGGTLNRAQVLWEEVLDCRNGRKSMVG